MCRPVTLCYTAASVDRNDATRLAKLPLPPVGRWPIADSMCKHSNRPDTDERFAELQPPAGAKFPTKTGTRRSNNPTK